MARVEIIREDAAFSAMADEWNDLLVRSQSDQPFLTWEWLHAWWTHLRDDRSLHLIAVREGGRLIALAPLAERPGRYLRLQPFPLLEFLGSGVAGSDYLDFIIDRDHQAAALDALSRHFDGERRIMELSRTQPSSSCARELSGRLDDAGWSVALETNEVCPFIDTAGHDWDSYLETVGSSHRYNVRRRFRKLEKTFQVEIERCAAPAQLQGCLDELLRLHHLRRDGLGGSDAFHTRALVAFHRDFTARALARGWLRLYVMKLDGRAVAAVYGLRYGDIFYFYQSGFDPDFNKFSVGLVALGHSIRDAIAEGVREYDLLHGDEGYKFRWASGQRPLCRLTLFPPNTRGKLSQALADVKGRLKMVRNGRSKAEGEKWRAA